MEEGKPVMLNVDFLKYVVEFAKSGNLTKTSEALHISQSALTRAMQKIETEVGVPLFERTRNRIELSETGKEFVKYAERVLNAQTEMIERTVAFHNASLRISIGLSAPGPMLKYGQIIFATFPNRAISSKIDTLEALLKGLKNDLYDFLFINEEILSDDVVSIYAFTEDLFVSVPPTHFVSGMTEGVHFSEIDGQSFLVAENLGLWDDMIHTYLPNSRFFRQNLENLNEIVNGSTIPAFSTNVSIPLRDNNERIDIPILDEIASVDFYIAFRKKDQPRLKELLRAISAERRK